MEQRFRDKDSNLNKQSQNLLNCRYSIPERTYFLFQNKLLTNQLYIKIGHTKFEFVSDLRKRSMLTAAPIPHAILLYLTVSELQVFQILFFPNLLGLVF